MSSGLRLAWQGALWKILSCACFAGMNGIVRYLSGGSNLALELSLPVYVIDFFQNIFGALFLLPWFFKHRQLVFSTQHLKLHCLRVVIAVIGIGLWYFTLKVMPIAQGLALSFLGPVFTACGACLFLKEKLSGRRLLAVLLSFIGAFFILKPHSALNTTLAFKWVALFPLLSACAFSCSNLLTRKLASMGERPATLASYLLIFMIPVSALPAALDWTTPLRAHWHWLFLLGFLAALAHFAFSKAYSLAEVTFLMPFGFFKFLLSFALGYYVFSEWPENLSIWSGMGIILLSLLLLSIPQRPLRLTP